MSHKIATRSARLVWKALNGVFAVYKPPSVSMGSVINTLRINLCRDLNQLDVRPPNDYVKMVGQTNDKLSVVVEKNYADDIQLVGPRYQIQDVKIYSLFKLPIEASGVILLGLQDRGMTLLKQIESISPTKFYRVTGKLGIATYTGFTSGKVAELTTYNHISRFHIDKLCSSLQSSHQKTMYQFNGIDIQSQAAYDLAKEGLLKPSNKHVPLIYSIKCTQYKRPYFDLELACVNENENYIKSLIDEIGILLKSSATCKKINCFQYALFDSQMALLTKHWTLSHILNNIQLCDSMLKNNESLFEEKSSHLIKAVT